MATAVKVPSMGESISTGILSTWHVKDGDVVSAGQVLYDLETDKITSEGMAECAGKITLKVAIGDEVTIGQTIAEIDESVSAPAQAAPSPTTTPSAASKVAPQTAISPAVHRIAAETGIDPASLLGTGKGGRVTKGDMLAVGEKAPAQAHMSSTSVTPSALASGRTSQVKMTPLRRKVAERLLASQRDTASLTTFNEVDMAPIMELRKKHQEKFLEKHGIKLGFMSFFVKAVVQALKTIPAINAQIEGDSIVQNHFYDIGVAVGGPKGLMVPVVRNCDQLGFHEIEQSIVNYAKRVRDGKLAIDDMMGGVFTITNGGIYGSMLSTPILNYPQSAILGMHNIKERAVVVNGEITVRPMMYLALTYDHRIVDGKEAVTFLNHIKDSLEDPARLLFNI